MGWEDNLNEEERADWNAFVRSVREDTIKSIDESLFVMQITPDKDDFDVKFAVELGAAILFDKPLLLVALPGRSVPKRLAMVADKIIYADLDTEEGTRQLAEAIKEFGQRVATGETDG